MYKELSTITITDYSHACFIGKKKQFPWTHPKVQEELKQVGVLFNGDLHAVKILGSNIEPLFALGMGDKHRIIFPKEDGKYLYCFPMNRTNDLYCILDEAVQSVLIDRKQALDARKEELIDEPER